jgi:hypothetical protein
MVKNEIIVVTLSTQQELVNALALEQLAALETNNQLVRVDSLQTETAQKREWSTRLKTYIEHKRPLYGEHNDVSLSLESTSDEYNPDKITSFLWEHYGAEERSIAWLYSGAQKSQSIGLFQAFKKRLEEGHEHDLAVSLETSQGRRQLHLFRMVEEHLQHEVHNTTANIDVDEYAMLFGQYFQRETGYRIWPGLGQRWGAKYPRNTNPPPRTDIEALTMTQTFARSAAFRESVRQWSRGKVQMTNSRGEQKGELNDPYTAFFEYAVVERLFAFLEHHKESHRVVDARAGYYRKSSGGTRVEYDVLLTLSTGQLIAFDAKSGSSKDSYRKQKRGVEEIGGYSAQLFYISPWFPAYIHTENSDDAKEAWDPFASGKSGGVVWQSSQKELQKVYESWQTTDETFGVAWQPNEELQNQYGNRPPDYEDHPQFWRSLLIPFDAPDANGEGLFEKRLHHLLC